VPDNEKSLAASPVTASLKVMLYERFDEFVIVAVGAKVVSDGPNDSMVT
jgi:hypothetical protein